MNLIQTGHLGLTKTKALLRSKVFFLNKIITPSIRLSNLLPHHMINIG